MNSVLAAKRGAENKVSLGLIYLSCSSPQDIIQQVLQAAMHTD